VSLLVYVLGHGGLLRAAGPAARGQVRDDIVEQISDAMTQTGPDIRAAMRQHPKFRDIGKRMLLAWHDGLASLRSKRVYAMGEMVLGKAFTGFSDLNRAKTKRKVTGRSELLGKR
jgi:serine/threonine-protein kinase HipA